MSCQALLLAAYSYKADSNNAGLHRTSEEIWSVPLAKINTHLNLNNIYFKKKKTHTGPSYVNIVVAV